MTPAAVMAIAFLLKDGAGHANFTWIGSAVTLLSVGVFVAWIAYALFSRSSQMEAAANLPFEDMDGAE